MEYAGYLPEHGFDEAYEEWYREEQREYTEKVITESMGNGFRIETDNLDYFRPWDDYRYVMEDDYELRSVTHFLPGEFVHLTPPYTCACIQLKDKEDRYYFIADANGTVLAGIKYRFFQLEKK